MTAGPNIEGRLQAATTRCLQAKREVERARENLVDVVLDAGQQGGPNVALKRSYSRVTINTWTQSRRQPGR